MGNVKRWVRTAGLPFAAGFLSCVVIIVWGAVAMLIGPRAEASTNDVAAGFGVQIIWVENIAEKCGDMTAGCWEEITPDTIYIGSKLEPEATRHAVLHELGHVMQNRLGQPFDECKADDFAQALGSTMQSYKCP